MYGIFTNFCPKNHPNVGKYTSTMEQMGYTTHYWELSKSLGESKTKLRGGRSLVQGIHSDIRGRAWCDQ